MAQAPVPGQCKRLLEPLVGRDGCVALQRALLLRAAAWALSVAPEAAHVALHPASARDEVAELIPPELDVFAQDEGALGDRLAAAVARVAGRARAVLVAGIDVPQLGPAHAAGALEDVAAGCDVSLGPSTDGGSYLLGLARPDRDLLAGAVGAWARTEITARALEATRAGELSVGLLRSERELHAPGDARALVADPLAPSDIVERLRGGRWSPTG
jgi:glycosyltransferase A (GT-A) superfamily protein (DUF2064 family)